MSERAVSPIRAVSNGKLIVFAARVDSRKLPKHAAAVAREIEARKSRGEWRLAA